jgi:hypothetical protein
MYIQDDLKNDKKAKTKGEKKVKTGEKLKKGPKLVGSHWRIKSQWKEKVVDDVDKMKAVLEEYSKRPTIGRSSLLLFSLSDQFIFTT